MKTKENKSFFLMQFGDTPQLRVLDFLIGFHFFDYPLTEIARGANVSYNSLKVFFPSWIKSDVVVKTRRVGKSDYFKLNLNNVFIKNLSMNAPPPQKFTHSSIPYPSVQAVA